MFASKSSLFLAFIVASAQIVSAARPACLLLALVKYQDPADMQSLCVGDNASSYQSKLCEICGSNLATALSDYQSSCTEKGYTASNSSSCASSSNSSSSSSSSTSASGSASASASVSGAPYGSGNGTLIYTSTYYDTVCSCTKTSSFSTTNVAGSTGFASATTGPIASSGGVATGSPIAPTASASSSSTTSAKSSPSSFTGAASKSLGSLAAVVIAIVGVALTL